MAWSKCCACVSAVLALGAGPACAQALPDSVQVHGFFSQGFVLTDANNYNGGSEDNGTFDFREIGLNVSWQAMPKLLFAAQGVARWAGDVDNGSPKLDYALMDWTPWMRASSRAGLRVGRVKVPFGLYNKTRDVAHTRPGITMPSVYFESARDLMLSLDGAGVFVEKLGSAGSIEFETVTGKTRKVNLSWPGMGDIEDVDITNTYMSRLFYETPGGFLGAALTYATADIAIRSSTPFGPLLLDAPTDIYGLSLQLTGAKWQLTGEYFLSRFATSTDFFSDTLWSPGYYVQGNWSPTEPWGVYLRYDAIINDRDDKSGREAAAATGLPRHLMFQKTWIAGLRYDVNPQVRLMAELLHGNGTADLSLSTRSDPAGMHRRWNGLMLQAAFRF